MKKNILILIILLFISGCSGQKPEQVITLEETEQIIIEQNDTFKTLIPYSVSESRGYVIDYQTTAIDYKAMEDGLIEIAQEYLNIKDYIFMEGQIITPEIFESLIARQLTQSELQEISKENYNYKDLGLNPTIESGDPKYLSAIIEHDYYIKKGDEYILDTIVIGLGIKGTYTNDDGSTYQIDEEELEAKGKNIANRLITLIRSFEEYENVDVIIGVFILEDDRSLIPGHYVTYGKAEAGKGTISNWNSTNTDVVLFPSEEASENYSSDTLVFEQIKDHITSYFPNYVGIYATGYYKDGSLYKIVYNIPMIFYSEMEIVTFTNYVNDIISQQYPGEIDYYIYIESPTGIESIIYRENKNEVIHILK